MLSKSDIKREVIQELQAHLDQIKPENYSQWVADRTEEMCSAYASLGLFDDVQGEQ